MKEAYDICVDTKSKFIFSYVAKLIENWHNEGYKKPQDIKSKKTENKMQGAYDIDLFEKMISSKD